MLYAITDIETTGSHASAHSITEIAICLFDGSQVVDEYQTLINPGTALPRFITTLTGITDEMLEDSPAFAEVAEEVHSFLKDAVFVAHNVNFDYSFIRAELQACGINWNPPRLCTVRLARKAFPGFRSYGLEKLCRELGVINTAAHRAMGDTRATMEIFSKILRVVPELELRKMLGKGATDYFLPNHLNADEFSRLPEKPGVYYLRDQNGKPIYIGKANNLKKRVRTHFSPATESERHQQFIREIHHVDFVLTGNELIALLLEDAEIRQYWPRHNRAQKRTPSRHGIFEYTDGRGLIRLGVNAVGRLQNPLRAFGSKAAAHRWLVTLADQWELDYAAVGLPTGEGTSHIEPDEHNAKLRAALGKGNKQEKFLIAGSGRDHTERGCVLVVDGRPFGYGFLPADHAVQSEADVVAFLTLLPLTETNVAIVRNFLEDPRGMQIIPLNAEVISDF